MSRPGALPGGRPARTAVLAAALLAAAALALALAAGVRLAGLEGRARALEAELAARGAPLPAVAPRELAPARIEALAAEHGLAGRLLAMSSTPGGGVRLELRSVELAALLGFLEALAAEAGADPVGELALLRPPSGAAGFDADLVLSEPRD